jgi:hypothetical protein
VVSHSTVPVSWLTATISPVPVTAVPGLDRHVRVPELLLLLGQPPAIRPAATTSAALRHVVAGGKRSP